MKPTSGNNNLHYYYYRIIVKCNFFTSGKEKKLQAKHTETAKCVFGSKRHEI